MWYTPTFNNGVYSYPAPERKGEQFGPFVLFKNEDEDWQIDHWPSGFRCLPNKRWPFLPNQYKLYRSIASRLKTQPVFREKWDPPSPETRDNGRQVIEQTLADLGVS